VHDLQDLFEFFDSELKTDAETDCFSFEQGRGGFDNFSGSFSGFTLTSARFNSIISFFLFFVVDNLIHLFSLVFSTIEIRSRPSINNVLPSSPFPS